MQKPLMPRAQSWDPCWIQPTQVKGLAWPGVQPAHLLEVTVPHTGSVTAAHPGPHVTAQCRVANCHLLGFTLNLHPS